MLARIEEAYLSLLRVVILVSATIALIIAAFGLISSVPSMLRWAGISQPEKALGGTLRDFISEQRITNTEAVQDSGNVEVYAIMPQISEAGEIIHIYLEGRADITERDWRIGLQSTADEFFADREAYADSVLRVAMELKASKGNPLSEERVLQLMDWNATRFRNDLEMKRLGEAQEVSEFWVKLAAAGTGFLTFVAIIFIFLFVKIERNLRPPPNLVGDQISDGGEAE